MNERQKNRLRWAVAQGHDVGEAGDFAMTARQRIGETMQQSWECFVAKRNA